MLEVPHNWSSGLRRSLVALLGTVAAEEYNSRRVVQTPGTKEHGSLFAELYAHLNIFLAKMT